MCQMKNNERIEIENMDYVHKKGITCLLMFGSREKPLELPKTSIIGEKFSWEFKVYSYLNGGYAFPVLEILRKDLDSPRVSD